MSPFREPPSERFERIANFRDLGGYPAQGGRTLRWRVLFRSDALHALSAGDVAQLRDGRPTLTNQVRAVIEAP